MSFITDKFRRSGQPVRTEVLLAELTRLGCRFRQSGSHITFNHDETGVRGTIVYGTKKAWSQRTAADAIDAINSFTVPANSGEGAQKQKQKQKNVDGVISSEGNKVLGGDRKLVFDRVLPEDIEAETLPIDDKEQIVLWHKEWPMLGVVIPKDHNRNSLDWALYDIFRQHEEFTETLGALRTDYDFQFSFEDDTMTLKHAVLAIGAVFYPFSPEVEISANDVLDSCYERLMAYDQNRDMFEAFVSSRRLELDRDSEVSTGVQELTFVCKKLHGEFKKRARIKISSSGWINDEALLCFMDDVDSFLFNELRALLHKRCGYEVTYDKRAGFVDASHPFIEDMNVRFTAFKSLPLLMDVYKKRGELSEERYIHSLNEILEERDKILDLVSSALMLALDEVQERSNLLFDILDKLLGMQAQLTSGVPEGAGFDKKIRSLTKKLTKGQKSKFVKQAAHMSESFRKLRTQDLPQDFPYGKITKRHFSLFGDDNFCLEYMILRGADSTNLMLPTWETLRTLDELYQTQCKNFGIDMIDDYEQNPVIMQLREQTRIAVRDMAVSLPDARVSAG